MTTSNNKILTYNELMELAKEFYNEGGDGIYECWDECTYNYYVQEFGPITVETAFVLFGVDADHRAWAQQTNI